MKTTPQRLRSRSHTTATPFSFGCGKLLCSPAIFSAVRMRYALTNSKYKIALDDLPASSPYNDGRGDWAGEWSTIYPDGTHVRHMKIHTALAVMSQPFSFFREPPNVVHDSYLNGTMGW